MTSQILSAMENQMILSNKGNFSSIREAQLGIAFHLPKKTLDFINRHGLLVVPHEP